MGEDRMPLGLDASGSSHIQGAEESISVSMPLDLLNRGSSDEEDFDDYANSRPRGFRGCLRSRPCSVCLYLILVLLLLSSFMSVVVVIVLVAVPYHQASQYVATECTPVRVNLDYSLRKCSCGKGCTSRYPCLALSVTYVRGEEIVESILADDESLIDRQCSFYPPCLTSSEKNIAAVRFFEQRFGNIDGQPYACLYDPLNYDVVVRVRRFKLSHVVHGLSWSIVLFISSVALLSFALRFRGCSVL